MYFLIEIIIRILNKLKKNYWCKFLCALNMTYIILWWNSNYRLIAGCTSIFRCLHLLHLTLSYGTLKGKSWAHVFSLVVYRLANRKEAINLLKAICTHTCIFPFSSIQMQNSAGNTYNAIRQPRLLTNSHNSLYFSWYS